MMQKALLFIISLLLSCKGYSQIIRFDGWRVGMDPIRSLSFLIQDKQHKLIYSPRMVEGYAEFFLFGKTSVIIEPGYAKSFLQLPSTNYRYDSKGYYLKAGLDFDISHPNERAEVTLGWRLGMNEYTEHAEMNLWNEYYGEHLVSKMPENKKKFMWGEFLLTHKYCLFEHPVKHNKIYFAVTLKVKTSNRLPDGHYPSLVIPGYGFYKKYVAGVNFSLAYHFHAKRNVMKDLRRRRFNHQQYKIDY